MRGRMMVTGCLIVLAGCRDIATPTPESVRAPVEPTPRGSEYRFSRCSCPTAIPDDDPAGVLIGPLSIPDDGRAIHDVVLEVEIFHPYGGDLSAWLFYDADNDGTYDAETPVEFYLARPGPGSPPMWSHPVDLEGVYLFRHEKEAAALDGWDAGTFMTFRGLDRGGSFYLRVVDRGDGGVGTVQSWGVHIK